MLTKGIFSRPAVAVAVTSITVSSLSPGQDGCHHPATERIVIAFEKQPRADQPTTPPDELCATELDAVIGGISWFEILNNAFKAQGEIQKAIAANIR